MRTFRPFIQRQEYFVNVVEIKNKQRKHIFFRLSKYSKLDTDCVF